MERHRKKSRIPHESKLFTELLKCFKTMFFNIKYGIERGIFRLIKLLLIEVVIIIVNMFKF